MPSKYNIIFDLGGVVLEWNPEAIVAEVFDGPNDRIVALSQIIGHSDWLELDRGTLELERAIRNATERTGRPRRISEDSWSGSRHP